MQMTQRYVQLVVDEELKVAVLRYGTVRKSHQDECAW